MPGCESTAEHKAPKHRGLNEYYRFCFDHAREYNNAWDFFSGMSGKEVQDHMMNSVYGDRPTWQYGVGGEGHAEDILRDKIHRSYHGSEGKEDSPRNGGNRGFSVAQNTPEFEAMALMGLEPPVTLEGIKARYKALAKKHHPDLNMGCEKSEELLKHINMAYTILKLAYKQFEQLPER
ncbi:MAG TPA: molecular chaperone DnaJ [Hellea balneolensis]|uniref:Molecular chaperone DnaJ n=1 Tax=Hellea balneolensis TaxID=287478 RepID=A0A7C3C225_9PROT|nr:molecular chaperone DnaJ [Hellea balneolensis]